MTNTQTPKKLLLATALLAFTAATPASAFMGGLFSSDEEVSDTPKAKEVPFAVGDAASLQPGISLTDIGVTNARTLWIPGKYTNTAKSQLYFGSKRFTTSAGYDNVMGFINAPYGYLVAVLQPPGSVAEADSVAVTSKPMSETEALRQELAMMRKQLGQVAESRNTVAGHDYKAVLYRVSATGAILSSVGSINVGKNAKALVTPSAIYVLKAGVRDTGNTDVAGYTTDGVLVDGPQDVNDAAPGPDGSWMVVRSRYDYNATVNDWIVIDKAGEQHSQYKGSASSASFYSDEMHVSEHIMVDLPTVSDSFATGHVFTITFNNGRGPIGGYARGNVQIRSFTDTPDFFIGGATSLASIRAAAAKSTLVASADGPLFVGQASTRKLNSPGKNIYTVMLDHPAVGAYPLYQMMSAGKGFLRDIMSNTDSGDFLEMYNNDLFVVQTPTDVIALNTTKPSTATGYSFVTHKAVTASSAMAFVTKYNLVN